MATPTTTRKDPLPVFCFKVQFDNLSGTSEGYFRNVSGLKFETEIVPVSAGGPTTRRSSCRARPSGATWC